MKAGDIESGENSLFEFLISLVLAPTAVKNASHYSSVPDSTRSVGLKMLEIGQP